MNFNNLYSYHCATPFKINGVDSIFNNNKLYFVEHNKVINFTKGKTLQITEHEYKLLFQDCKIVDNVPKQYIEGDEDLYEDSVNHPSHYTWLKDKCGIEVLDITRHLDFNLGNVIKYVLRSGRKTENGMDNKSKQIEDLKKAVFYLNDEIEMLNKHN